MALYLVRHAKAGSRSHEEPDEERALNDAGLQQATRIGELLAANGIERILTSRYTRCVETVLPLAERAGVGIEVHESLAEEADVEQAWELLEQLAGTNAVLCSHGNILSPLLDRVHRRGADVEAEEWSCHKGSVWRLEPDGDGAFVRAVQDLLQA
jgi:phosphohistidine phosphatase SixA